MDEMNRIVICNHCGEPEYFGEMRWLSGICSCRNCYKGQYERERREIYRWTDLDGRRPTMDEYINQVKKDIEIEAQVERLTTGVLTYEQE